MAARVREITGATSASSLASRLPRRMRPHKAFRSQNRARHLAAMSQHSSRRALCVAYTGDERRSLRSHSHHSSFDTIVPFWSSSASSGSPWSADDIGGDEALHTERRRPRREYSRKRRPLCSAPNPEATSFPFLLCRTACLVLSPKCMQEPVVYIRKKLPLVTFLYD